MSKEPEPTKSLIVSDGSDQDETEGEEWSTYLRLVYSQELPPSAGPIGRMETLSIDNVLVAGRDPERKTETKIWQITHDSCVSRNHVSIKALPLSQGKETEDQNNAVLIQDMGSHNGTFLDGVKVDGQITGGVGQILRIGGTLFIIGRAPIALAEKIQNLYPIPETLDAWSWSILSLWRRLIRHAQGDFSILLLGETGTGKTQLAKQVHLASPRRNGPFVTQNCAAIPHPLEEAILFGVAAAFVPGVKEKKGLLTMASNGSLFLDELAELPQLAQAKLLDAFDTTNPTHCPVGGNKRIPTKCRLISATNRNVEDLVKAGVVRADIVSRLVAVQELVPPLRNRREDILKIFGKLLQDKETGAESVTRQESLFPSVGVAEAMLLAKWPENVRGLASLASLIQSGEKLTSTLVKTYGERGANMDEVAKKLSQRVDESNVPNGKKAIVGKSESGKNKTPIASKGIVTKGSVSKTSIPWPPTPEELVTLLDLHCWNVNGAGKAIGKRRETMSRFISKMFAGGGKVAAQKAHQIWKASGRMPSPDFIEPLFIAYFEKPDTVESQQMRTLWELQGELPHDSD